MNHWPFILASYALALGGTLTLVVHSFLAMHRAEAQADALKADR